METKRYPQFLLIGDSHIQNSGRLQDGFSFGAALYGTVERQLDVVNRGFSGYNTSHMLKILDQIVPSPAQAKVDYLLLLLGSNDACLPGSPSKQHIPLEEYRGNIKSIINHPSVKAHSPRLLLVTPPPVHEIHLEKMDAIHGEALTRHQAITVQYAQVIRDVASESKEQDVVVIDLWDAMMRKGIASVSAYDEKKGLFGSRGQGDSKCFRNLLSDGLHLTGVGYQMFFDEVLRAMGGNWADESSLHKDAWLFPPWEVAPKLQ